MEIDLKTQILNVFESQFKSNGTEPPKTIELKYQDGKKIQVIFDDGQKAEPSFAQNMFMKSFLISQLKNFIGKQTKEKVSIPFALTVINLQTKEISLSAYYNTPSTQNNLFTHTL